MWVFFATDAVLVGAAALVAYAGPRPLSTNAILAIVACVIAGAVVALVPLIARVERRKNESLDDRQRALEALARTVAASADQISIAASGFHEIAELAQKNLRHAEQLPHKLQDKIAEFQAQLANANDTEKEELEKEVVSLRSAESERLETVATKMARAVAEFAKIEASTQQHLAAANEAIAKLSFGAAAAIGKAQVAAEQALAHARIEAARGLGDTAGQAAQAIEKAKLAAVGELEGRLGGIADGIVDKVVRQVTDKLRAAPSEGAASSHAPVPPTLPTPSAARASGAENSTAPAAPSPEAAAAGPKRPRKPKRDDSAASDADRADTPAAGETNPPTSERVETTPPVEPAPVPAQKITEITPIVPPTAEPFSGHIVVESLPTSNPETAPAASAVEAGRKRTTRKTEDEPVAATKAPVAVSDEEPGLGLDEPEATAGVVERVMTSDGATRLIVTAYIGIGNRLFIRGAGPGLSWQKGVPLQFVSIGKWRWETNAATAPVSFKIFKNDEMECTALGAQSLEPGYQQEVAATF
jgi:hypothetical protein